MRYPLSYIGIAVNASDPMGLGRVQVRVPQVYGVQDDATPFASIPDQDLPWAIPCALPGSKTAQNGAISFVPDSGARLLVRFLDGEPEKPVWEFLMQTADYRNVWAAVPAVKGSEVKPNPQSGTGGSLLPQDVATFRKAGTATVLDANGATTTSKGKSIIGAGNLKQIRKRAESESRVVADPEEALDVNDNPFNTIDSATESGSADDLDLLRGAEELQPPVKMGGGEKRPQPPLFPFPEPPLPQQ